MSQQEHLLAPQPSCRRRLRGSGMAPKNTVIACVSNLSTAYNLVVINIVHVFVQNQYCALSAP